MAPPAREGVLSLADAFSDFIAASETLERSYRELQAEVGQLSRELAVRNKELESSLAENKAMRVALSELIDSMPCGVLVLGPEELHAEPAQPRLLRMNPEAWRLLGIRNTLPRDLEELQARTGLDLQPFCAMEGENEFSFCPGSSPQDLEMATGQNRRWLNLRTRRLPQVTSGMQTILIFADITAHKQAEEQREAGRRSAALAEIAAMLAHEVRNPLAGMELFAALIDEEPSRSREWTQHLRAGLRKLAGTVNNVLSFHGTDPVHLQLLEFGEVVRAAAEFARPVTEQAGITLQLQNHRAEGMVLANEAAVQQLVLNLVLNSVRHTPWGGTITIAISPIEPSCLRLSVADTGCGIAPEDRPHVFEAGWSAAGTNSGLGLAVCRQIAKQHRAVLYAADLAGPGACFHLEVPCA